VAFLKAEPYAWGAGGGGPAQHLTESHLAAFFPPSPGTPLPYQSNPFEITRALKARWGWGEVGQPAACSQSAAFLAAGGRNPLRGGASRRAPSRTKERRATPSATPVGPVAARALPKAEGTPFGKRGGGSPQLVGSQGVAIF